MVKEKELVLGSVYHACVPNKPFAWTVINESGTAWYRMDFGRGLHVEMNINGFTI